MWVRREDVLWRTAAGYLVVSTLDGEPIEMSGPAGEIWMELDRPREVAALASELAQRYGATRGTVLADVTRFIDDMAERGLLVRTGGS